MEYAKSRHYLAEAKKSIPGGLSRNKCLANPDPVFIERGDGAYVIDVDGNRYLDFNNNYTTLIHGHGHAPTVSAVTEQINKGFCFGAPTTAEMKLAGLLTERVPGLEQVRFQSTGTEAVMMAIKAARAYTGRPMIAKIEGAYHGTYDYAEVSENIPESSWQSEVPPVVPIYHGAPESMLAEVLVIPQNNTELAVSLIRQHAHRLAAVLIDPMPSLAGLIPLKEEFVRALRSVTEEYGMLLISDEVLNFRQSFEGAIARYGIRPDLITIGKIIGGGMPIGATGGSREVMSVFDHSKGLNPLPASGTFSANPVTMTAGFAAMSSLDHAAFERLSKLGDRVRSGLTHILERTGTPGVVTGTASLFRIHLINRAVNGYRDSVLSPDEMKKRKSFLAGMLDRGFWISHHGMGTLTTPMTDGDIDAFLSAAEDTLISGK